MATKKRCQELLHLALRDDPGKLHINMLGGCSLSNGQQSISDQVIRSKKPWLLLEFLIAFRDRELSQNELIEAVYPEGKSENPVNALKTLVHRIRAMLDELHFSDSKNMILQTRGTYMWNNQLNFDVDTELFDQLYTAALESDTEDGDRMECLLAAAHLYSGDLLPKSAMESWVIRLSAYYHSRYLDAVSRLCDLLRRQSRFEDIVTVCRHAVDIDPYEESLYYHLLCALVDLGRHQTALTVYKDMTDLFYREFGVTPSDNLTSLYREIIKSIHTVETDLGVIKEKLREDTAENGAFLCEFEVFKDIYRLEVRAAARTGESVFLCLITLSSAESVDVPVKALNTNMDRLSSSIKYSLRRGDVYAKYSVAQYLLMLPTITYENCEMVLSRIIRRFRKDAPNCPLQPTFSIQPIDMVL
ncbi:winged helix-turn-helix domain-containing protein [Intestinibacillus massiliensis]|nr:winged helix-turn-helix domain-containing protein [Intestinibacillus massiliensis]